MNENEPVYYQDTDGEWHFIGYTDAAGFEFTSAAEGEEADVPFEPGGILQAYSQADIDFCANYPQRFVLGLESAHEGFVAMGEAISSMAETLREVRADYPHLFEDIEPFVSSDAMSVRYTDDMADSPW